MSEENINLSKENENFNNIEETKSLFMQNIISKFDFIDKSLNFVINNFPKDEPQIKISLNFVNLFYKRNKLFFDKLCLIKDKIDLFIKDNNITIKINDNENKELIDNINNENNNLLDFNSFSKLKKFFYKYCEYMKEIGNIFIEYSDNILNEIKIDKKDFDENFKTNENNFDKQNNIIDNNSIVNKKKEEKKINIQNIIVNKDDLNNIENLDEKEPIKNIENGNNKNCYENNKESNNNDINFNKINIDNKIINIVEQKEEENINIIEKNPDEIIITEENKNNNEKINVIKEKKEENIIFNDENFNSQIENGINSKENQSDEIKKIKNKEEKNEEKKEENILEIKEELEKNINIKNDNIVKNDMNDNEEEKHFNNLQKEEEIENNIVNKEKHEQISILNNELKTELEKNEKINKEKNNIMENEIENIKIIKSDNILDIKDNQDKIKENTNVIIEQEILDKAKINISKDIEYIKDNIKKISEEIICSIIKTEIVEQKIIFHFYLKNVEKNIIDSLIDEIIKEKCEEKEKNKQDKNLEKKEKEEILIEEKEKEEIIKEEKAEMKDEENKEIFIEKNSSIKENEKAAEIEDIIEDNLDKNDKIISEINANNEIILKVEEQLKNQENKVNKEINNENLNNSFLENIGPNIDSLLGDINEEEENTNINEKSIKKSEIIDSNDEKDKIDVKNIEEKKEKNEKEKKDEKKILDDGIRDIMDLLIDNVINNKSNQNDIGNIKNEDNREIKINEEELKNESKIVADKIENEKIINHENIDNNLNIINPEQNIKNVINTQKKENIINESKTENNININNENIINKDEIDKINNNENKLESKENDNKNKDDEFDFDLDEEMDIDLIIQNKSISEVNLNKQKEKENEKEKEKEKEDLKLKNISLSESINKKQKGKEKIYDIINKENNINNKEKNEKDLIIKSSTFTKQNKVINNLNIIENNKNNIIKNEPKLILPLLPSIRDKEFYIESAIKKMFSKSEILQDEIKTLKDILFKNESIKHFFSFFINCLLKRINKKTKFLSSFENFKTLSNIIQNICIKEDRAYVYDSIMEISKYIKYENYYLYQFIRNKINHFKNNEFWKALINNLLLNSLNDRVKYLIKREKQKNESVSLTERCQKKSPFWKDFFLNVFKDINSDDEEEFINQKEYESSSDFILYSLNYSKNINDYQKLNNELKKELDIYCKKSLEKILYKTIKNMSYFGFNNNNIKIVILDFCARFEFSNETKEYFINLIDCYELHNYKILKRNLSLNDKYNKINDKSYICIISNIFIFLPIKERIKLFLLNKQFNIKNNLKKEIFIKILTQKNISLSNRLIIWEVILNISKLKSKYNYQEIKESTFKRLSSGELQKGTRPYNNNETITKDVKRTVFLVNKEDNQKKLSNLLRCLNLLNPSIGYYQGISYIAAFFLQMLDFDEEKTFFYMLSLETQTDYKNIFLNNLEMLNDNFKIFDKIIEIGLPDVSLHLNKLRVTSDFFAPSWFLTIFMCISPLFDKKDISKFCLLVFEKFILDGWESVFIAGFTALKYCYRELLKINETMIYTYLTNDFAEQDIFKNILFDVAESDFINNSEFINNILISLVKNICCYEKKNKDEED